MDEKSTNELLQIDKVISRNFSDYFGFSFHCTLEKAFESTWRTDYWIPSFGQDNMPSRLAG